MNVSHQHYMQRAMDLALTAEGRTSPNPMVGAVIVKEGRIIGEGYHRRAGEPHAEVEALNSVSESPNGATMYVTLEPCCVQGRTPPCTQALIQAGIAELYYGASDENPAVSGGGHAQLEAAGITVHKGPLTELARFINRDFFHFITHKTPYVIAKYAMSLDGRIACAGGDSRWITSETARTEAHGLRNASDAVLVGSGTAVADNPKLTTRLPDQEVKHPLRVLLDASGRTPLSHHLLDADLEGRTLVVIGPSTSSERRRALEAADIEVYESPERQGRIDLPALLAELGRRGVMRLMVEGGGLVLGSFFDERLIHEVWAFMGAKLIGGQKAPGPIAGLGSTSIADSARAVIYQVKNCDPDVLIKAKLIYPSSS